MNKDSGMDPAPAFTTLMQSICDAFPVDEHHYPALAALPGDLRKAFAVSHSVHHMCKSIGRIASECEATDHGAVMKEDVLREAAAKMLINTLKLAADLGMTAQDLELAAWSMLPHQFRPHSVEHKL